MNSTSMRQQGARPLWVVFWLWGVLVSHILFGLILYSFHRVDTPVFGLMLVGFLGYTAWILRAVWRHCGNVRNPVHGQLARTLTATWAINALLVSWLLILAHAGRSPVPLPL